MMSLYVEAQVPISILYGNENSDRYSEIKFDTTENAFFAIGRTNYSPIFSKIDTMGNILWTKSYDPFPNDYPLNHVFSSFTKSPTGDFLLAGAILHNMEWKYVIVRIDPQGNLVWYKTYNSPRRIMWGQIVSSTNDTYFVTGWLTTIGITDNIGLMKIDGSGNILWTREYEGGGDDELYNIIPSANGGCTISGSAGIGIWSAFILEVDANGQITSAKQYGDHNTFFYKVIHSNDNGYLASGRFQTYGGQNRGILVKINAAGQVDWAREYHSPNGGSITTSVVQDVYNNIYMSNVVDAGFPYIEIVKLDEYGNVIGGKRLESAMNSNPFFESLFYNPAKPNQLVVSGGVENDPNGFGDWDCLITITDTSLNSCLTTDFNPYVDTIAMPVWPWGLTSSIPAYTPHTFNVSESVNFGDELVCCTYTIDDTSIPCPTQDTSGNASIFCIPLIAQTDVPQGVIGLDFCLEYDNNVMTPTGNVTLGDVVLNNSPNADYYINTTTNPNQLHVSIFYTPQAPTTAEFVGSGEIACIEFSLNNNFMSNTSPVFSVCEIIESYDIYTETACANSGSLSLTGTAELEGRILFWDDANKPLRYDSLNPSNYLITEISEMPNSCSGSPTTTPNLNGEFNYMTTSGGGYVHFSRDIDCSTPVMSVINGMDCYLAGLVTTLDTNFIPNPYQMIAMDVNMDDRISAGDITHMQNRITQSICEFPQPDSISLDWRFIDSTTVQTAQDYQPSNTYPLDDIQGYSKYNVPDVPPCLTTPSSSQMCAPTTIKAHGILLGDVNGDWDANPPTASTIRMGTQARIIFDLSQSTIDQNGNHRIPILYEGETNLMGFDFTMDYNESRLSIINIDHSLNAFMTKWNDLEQNRVLFTSYANVCGGIPVNLIGYITLQSIDEAIHTSDLGTIESYFNGEPITVEIQGNIHTSINGQDLIESSIKIYPVPMNDQLIVAYQDLLEEVRSIQLYNSLGQLLKNVELDSSGQSLIDVSALPKGTYFVKINNSLVKKVMK